MLKLLVLFVCLIQVSFLVATNQPSSALADLASRISVQKILNWSENDVSKWLTDNKFNVFINTRLHSFTGSHLNELHQYQIQAPEVFVEIIRSPTVDMAGFMKFSVELKKLFKH